MTGLEIAVAAYCAYLVGSISSAIIVCKVMGLPDPRSEGSRNPGATNVLRIGGKKAAIITLFGDLLKGLIPVLLAKWYGFDANVIILIAFCAFIGHIFPIYYRFEGGKGVATFIGCLIGVNWLAALFWVAAWLIVAVISRYASLASIIASALAPLYLGFFTGNWVWVAVFSIMSLILIVRHYANIKKIYQGTENKLGKKLSRQ